jgi:isochorismate synthase
LGELVSELHPTPAVCGLPKQAAMDFIQSIEKHQRSYYSGFQGPVNIDDKLQLFVNLRCMQVMDERLILYIGCRHYCRIGRRRRMERTEIKADTLLSVIHKV